MRHKIFFSILLTICLVLSSCLKDEVVPVSSFLVDEMEIKASYTTANIIWHVEIKNKTSIEEVVLEYTTDSTFLSAQEVKMTKHTQDDKYIVTLEALENGTSYYLRCRAINKGTSLSSKIDSLRTLTHQLAEVRSDSITDVTVSSAMLHAVLLDWGTDSVPQVGFCIATHDSVTMADSCLVYPLTTNFDSVKYSALLDNLADNTTYYVRAYAINCKGVAYGEELHFTTTEIVVPKIGKTTVSQVTYTAATIKGEIVSNGGDSITERGVCYSTSQNPTIEGAHIPCDNELDSITCNLTDLLNGTTYYVRIYAVNSKGIGYGEEVSFETLAYGMPLVSTTEASNISYTSATCGGNVTEEGGQGVTDRGVCYSTSHNPTIRDNKVANGSGNGSFTCNLTELADGTTYYVRAFATNTKGTSYGEEITFTTTAYSKPVVATSDVTDISYISAICGGNVSEDGGQSVTDRGVCYSTSPNPTIGDSKVSGGNGTGSFRCHLTGLEAGTIYYVRAYATNSQGTSYGEEKIFTTTAYSLPTVTTTSASDISYTTATCGGSVTADGEHTVTERGVCYSTSSNPTIANAKVSNGSGLGSFTCSLTGLEAGTTYYFRAYATNSQGTAYGSEEIFTTSKVPLGVILYTSSAKLQETTNGYEAGLYINAFGGASIISHTYSNGEGLITFDATITTIGNYAFYKSSGLTSVTIPNSVTSIGVYAFGGCSGLTFITIPNSVTSIGNLAFEHCTGLTSIEIPNSVTKIEHSAFISCTSLTSVIIPNSVTSIGNSAFSKCTSLVTVTIPNSVTSIGEGAFYGCSSLTSPVYNAHLFAYLPNSYSGSYTIPNGIVSIVGGAFSNCTALTSIEIPNSVTSIRARAFSGCSSLTSVTIPNSVTSIGNGTFHNCSSLTNITIPNSVTSIGSLAFDLCTALTSIEIPNSVIRIEDHTFNGCSSLTFVSIPNSVISIGSSAFNACSSLTSVTCLAINPPALGADVFNDVDKTIPLYVPSESISAYTSSEKWKVFTNILPINEE